MKTWADDHPKAGLMARKRAAILEAAEAEFLRNGYKGTSMEGIAAAAGVSIMTLYRHAKSKDDLFGAVIARACSPNDKEHQARYAAMLEAPLRDALLAGGVMIQGRLADPQTTALFRTVMAASDHSPALAETAYRGLVGAHVDELAGFLAHRPEVQGMAANTLWRLCASFVDRLIGTEQLRLLLGLEGASEAERRDRAAAAADELAVKLATGP